MRYLIIMTFIGMLFLLACKDIHNTHRLRAVRNQNDKIKKHLLLDNPFSHFPSSDDLNFISATLLIPNEIGADTSRTQRAFSILICSMTDNTINIPKNYIKKSSFNEDDNFIVSMIFKENRIFDHRHDTFYPGTYPIPNFSEQDFQLGYEVIDTTLNQERFVYNIYDVPSDLETYVIEANHGSFWKTDYKPYRPNTMGKWREGYSKGIAISEMERIIVYWFLIW